MNEPEHDQESTLTSNNPHSKKAFAHLVRVALVTFCVYASPRAQAQDQPAKAITAVEFAGLKRTGETFVRDIVHIKAGDAFDKAALDEAVTRLLRTGRFQTAQYRSDEQPTASALRLT